MSAAGLLVQCGGQMAFIPAAVVRSVRYDVVVTQFPGTELGMVLLAGRIVPVISIGPSGRALVVCDIDGETVAFSGIEPIRSGFSRAMSEGRLNRAPSSPRCRFVTTWTRPAFRGRLSWRTTRRTYG